MRQLIYLTFRNNSVFGRIAIIGFLIMGIIDGPNSVTAAPVKHPSLEIRSQQTSVLIDDFEGSNSLDPWLFETTGPAMGSLSLGDGQNGQGAHVTFEIPASGAVSIHRNLTVPVDADGISIWIKAPSRVRIKICITEGNCQLPVRPFHAVNTSDWFRILVRLHSLTTIEQLKIYVELENSIVTHASGTIAFDDITVLQGSSTYMIDPQNMSVTPAFEYRARTLHDILGVDRNWAEGNDAQAITILESIGVKFARIGADWQHIEAWPNVYDFSTLDALISTHESGGITPVLIISTGTVVHTGAWNKPPLSNSELLAFGNYVQAVAQRYSGHGLLYDIWSEPTLPIWDPPLTAAQFATIVQVARQRIQAVDPSARVITGGLLNYDPDFVHEFLLAGGATGLDGFGVHSYNTRIPEVLGESLLMIRSEFEVLGMEPLPIWDTEWGFTSSSSTNDPTDINNGRIRQAQNVARQFLAGWGNGLNSVMYWHFRDTTQDPTDFDNFGLVQYNYEDKPAMQAVRLLSEIGSQRTLTGWFNDLPSDCYGLQLDGSNDVVLAIWCNAFPLNIQVPNSSNAIDFLGNPVQVTAQGDHSTIILDKLDWPIYITCYECTQLQHFNDVQINYWAWNFVERLYAAGITGGCNFSPLQYCPETIVNRAQMAVFLERGIHGSSYSPPAVGAGTGFSDVPANYWSAVWIKQLAADGITGGCGPGTYCPEYPVTRDQMAVFLLKSKYGASYTPPAVGAAGTGFADVPANHWAAPWIKQLAADGITSGCGGGNYCPTTQVTRAQMAVFLVKNFNLP